MVGDVKGPSRDVIAISDRVSRAVGAAVDVTADGDSVIVKPRSEDEYARVVRMAAAERWTVRPVGSGSWMPETDAAALHVVTDTLPHTHEVRPRDLIATVSANLPLRDLRDALRREGVWLPVDPPGDPARTIGSVVATATSGPLRGGFGPVRDQVIGASFVTPAGGVVRSGGRVVKNVAGFDLNKLIAGSFGAFGCITQLHLKLRVVPHRDLTITSSGSVSDLLQSAARFVQGGVTPAAFELLSPTAAGTGAWTLAMRLLGSDTAIAAGTARAGAAGIDGRLSYDDASREFWSNVAQRACEAPVTLRTGGTLSQISGCLDALHAKLGEGFVTAGLTTGTIRWNGRASTETLCGLRQSLAAEDVPTILERGPEETVAEVGHYGALRPGVGDLVDRLRGEFDPAGVMAVNLRGSRG